MPSRLVELLSDLDRAFSELEIKWYLFGAQAAILYGVARLTADVDVTVDPGEHSTAELVGALGRHGFALRVSPDEDFVRRSRVLPAVHSATGLPVDVVLAGPGLEELFLSRRRIIELEGLSVPVAALEDLIAMKLLAGRAKDRDDASALIATQLGVLDLNQLEATLGLLEQALDRRDLLPELQAMVDVARRARRSR